MIEEDNTTKYILEVPFLSQYANIVNTRNAHRSCGMTCVKMCLNYYGKDSGSLEDLVDTYINNTTAYGPSGWKHDFFVDFLKSFNLNSYRKEKIDIVNGLLELKKSLENNNLVIVSVEQRLFDKKLFHMILLVGFSLDKEGGLAGFFYNDPGRLTEESGAKQYVSVEDFVNYWRKMAIFTNS